mgnify:CR=1 FL=1
MHALGRQAVLLDDAEREWIRREKVVAFVEFPLCVQNRLIGVLGLIMTLIGLYHGVDTIYEMISVSDEPTEFQTLTSIIVFFRGLQLAGASGAATATFGYRTLFLMAAVLGVVITMGSLGGPPEEIGEKVAAYLLGPPVSHSPKCRRRGGSR